jgi:hypothetical protein
LNERHNIPFLISLLIFVNALYIKLLTMSVKKPCNMIFSAPVTNGNPPQKQSTKGVEFSRNKEGDSINDNIKAQ